MIWNRRQILGGATATTAMLCLSPRFARALEAGESDAAIVRAALTQLHPGLRRYAAPGALEQAIAAFDATMRAPADLPRRFLALARLAGLVKCGHTHVNFANQSDAVERDLLSARTRLPFRFRWIGRELVVTDGQRSGLAKGTRVDSINGVPARTILAALLPYARADGGNDGKRRRLLSVEGEHDVEAFDVFHPLLFPFSDDRVMLRLRTPDGRARSARLDCVDLAERRSWLAGREASRDANPGWTVEHRGRTAIMTMPNWAMYNSRWDWRGWIATECETLVRRDANALILDLRANEGGNDCGNEILARMIDAPLPTAQYERRVRYRRAPAELRPYLDTWNRSFDSLGEAGEDIGGGFYRLPEEPGDRAITPQGPRFRGRLLVLVGPQNSSATFQFANLVKSAGLGTLIGETTGGNRRGINGGGYYFLRLPESGLEMDVPLIGYFPLTPQPDAGVEPDLAAPESAADLALGRDSAMAAALRLAGA